CHHHNAYPWTF
nr:immunoglobulin light chain junction region [Macaca mulatta]